MERKGDSNDRIGGERRRESEREINEIKEIRKHEKEREKTSSCRNERADTLLSMGLRQMHIAMYILCFTRGSAFRSSKGAGGWPNTTAAVSARRSSIMYIQIRRRSTSSTEEAEKNTTTRQNRSLR